MYSLASLNAARRHRRHHRHHHRHNRAEAMSGSKRDQLAYFAGQKGVGGAVSGLLGYMDSYNGEPTFFATAGDPTSGVGLKAMVAIAGNLAQAFQIWTGRFMGKSMGALGNVIDGAIAGTADAGWFSWTYVQGNTYGAAKKASESPPHKTSGVGFNYDGAPEPRAMGVGTPRDHVSRAAAAVQSSGLAGYI